MSRYQRSADQRMWRRYAPVVAVMAMFILFVGLGDRPFLDYDEAIYARVMHDTQASGNLLTLSRAGEPFFEKPPLYFWSSMAFDSALHQPEWSYRLTSAIAGVSCIVLTMLLAFEVSGSGFVAVFSGVILLTTGAFVEASREVRLDIPVVASIMLAAFCFVRGARDKRWLFGVGVAVAVGIMFKIVIAFLAGVFILAWAVFHRNFGWLREWYLWGGAVAGALLIAPWHVYESVQFGQAFWSGYLWNNVVGRVGSDVLGGSLTIESFAKFFVVLTAPWGVAFVIGSLIIARGNPLRWDGMRRDLGVFVSTAAVITIVFAASATRIFYYLLPAYPFMAVAIAIIAEQARNRVRRELFAAALFLLIGVAVAVTLSVEAQWLGVFAINDAIANDEAQAGRILAANPEPEAVLTYQWKYWDTLEYYSGGRAIGTIKDGEVVQKSYFLIVHSEGNYSYPPSYAARLKMMYQGPALTLYKYTY